MSAPVSLSREKHLSFPSSLPAQPLLSVQPHSPLHRYPGREGGREGGSRERGGREGGREEGGRREGGDDRDNGEGKTHTGMSCPCNSIQSPPG